MSNYVICVFGSGGVGKSCITLQFVHNAFNPRYDPTIEDVYTTTIEIDEKQYTLEILDTAGSDEFASMRDAYINKANAFILVYSIVSQATFNDLENYYDRIRKNREADKQGMPPVVLVGNKVDLAYERLVSNDAGQSLARKWNCSFVETSAKDRVHVTELFYDLTREIIKKTQTTTKGPAKVVHYTAGGSVSITGSVETAPKTKKSCCCLL